MYSRIAGTAAVSAPSGSHNRAASLHPSAMGIKTFSISRTMRWLLRGVVEANEVPAHVTADAGKTSFDAESRLARGLPRSRVTRALAERRGPVDDDRRANALRHPHGPR